MKNLFYKILNLLRSIGTHNKQKPTIVVKYKKGKRFYSNTLIDTLIPQMVEIGDNFISAPGSIIVAHDASIFLFSKKYRIEKVIIGDNVFLGANSVILPGIIVGDNVIIGAGSVITKNVPSNSVVAGNPARVISTIAEYIDKCEEKGILYSPPSSLLNEFNTGVRFSNTTIEEFQNHVLQEYEKRLNNNP
jgi:acetyltransferase-like isoleucine patch superfamily enzyme